MDGRRRTTHRRWHVPCTGRGKGSSTVPFETLIKTDREALYRKQQPEQLTMPARRSQQNPRHAPTDTLEDDGAGGIALANDGTHDEASTEDAGEHTSLDRPMEDAWSFPETRLDVLVCAHELSPSQGSECAVGWNLVTRLARRHNVTVLCANGSQSKPFAYREAVEQFVEKNGRIDGLSFVFVDQPAGARLLAAANRTVFRSKRGVGFQPLFWLAVRAWQRAAFKRAAALEPERFDVVHHLTPIAYWSAGALWRFGRPYLWGPVTGIGGSSLTFARWIGPRAFVFEAARAAFNKLQMLTSFSFRRAIREATLVYTITSDDADAIGRLGKISVPMLETAATPHSAPEVRRYDRSQRLRLCWCGAHVNRKALPLLLEALADSNAAARTERLKLAERVELVVLGEGEETAAWKRMAERLGLENVSWLGQLTQSEVFEELRHAHVLVHTSVREGTPHVVLEAMSLGLPVVCHDAFGMGIAVTEACGIKIPLVSPALSIDGFRAAIERLILEPDLLERLSAGALQRASELTWDAIAARIAADYERLAERRLGASPAVGPAPDTRPAPALLEARE
jgi:glycosyltransferase involved in cell wall biosynthesis